MLLSHPRRPERVRGGGSSVPFKLITSRMAARLQKLELENVDGGCSRCCRGSGVGNKAGRGRWCRAVELVFTGAARLREKYLGVLGSAPGRGLCARTNSKVQGSGITPTDERLAVGTRCTQLHFLIDDHRGRTGSTLILLSVCLCSLPAKDARRALA